MAAFIWKWNYLNYGSAVRQNLIVYIPNKFNWITGCFSLIHYKLYSCKPKMCTLCFTSLYTSCRNSLICSRLTQSIKKVAHWFQNLFIAASMQCLSASGVPMSSVKCFKCPHQVIWELSLWARCRLLLLGGYSAESKVVYHLPEFSLKSSWKVNETRLFGSFHREISGSNGTSGKVVLFSGHYIPNRNPCSIFWKPSLILASGLRGCFLVNGTDL